jgi:hypothetical protein
MLHVPDLTILIIFTEDYELRSSPLGSYLQPPLTPPPIPLGVLFSSTVSPPSSLYNFAFVNRFQE